MNTTTAIVLTGGIVTVGQWVQDKKPNMKVWIGVAIVALFLSVMNEGDPKLAGQFGTLILIGAALIYAEPISKALKGVK